MNTYICILIHLFEQEQKVGPNPHLQMQRKSRTGDTAHSPAAEGTLELRGVKTCSVNPGATASAEGGLSWAVGLCVTWWEGGGTCGAPKMTVRRGMLVPTPRGWNTRKLNSTLLLRLHWLPMGPLVSL